MGGEAGTLSSFEAPPFSWQQAVAGCLWPHPSPPTPPRPCTGGRGLVTARQPGAGEQQGWGLTPGLSSSPHRAPNHYTPSCTFSVRPTLPCSPAFAVHQPCLLQEGHPASLFCFVFSL